MRSTPRPTLLLPPWVNDVRGQSRPAKGTHLSYLFHQPSPLKQFGSVANEQPLFSTRASPMRAMARGDPAKVCFPFGEKRLPAGHRRQSVQGGGQAARDWSHPSPHADQLCVLIRPPWLQARSMAKAEASEIELRSRAVPTSAPEICVFQLSFKAASHGQGLHLVLRLPDDHRSDSILACPVGHWRHGDPRLSDRTTSESSTMHE